MLRTLDSSQKEDWKSHVARLVHAYNCTPHSVSGYSPYFLMFGRIPRLPLDTLLEYEDYSDNVDQYSENLRNNLKEAFETTAKAREEAAVSNKRLYDRSARGIMPQVGELVLVRKLGFQGKHKIADKWEEDVYRVVKKDPELPVYTVVKDSDKSRNPKLRTMHRNHLFPVTWPIVKKITKNSNQPINKHLAYPCESLTGSDSDTSETESVDYEFEVTQARPSGCDIVNDQFTSEHDFDLQDGRVDADSCEDLVSDGDIGHVEEEDLGGNESSEPESGSLVVRRSTRVRRPPDIYQGGFHTVICKFLYFRSGV